MPKQPIRGVKSVDSKKKDKQPSTPKKNKIKKHTNLNTGEFGMSKLEYFFAKEYLDKNNIKYIYQYKAEDIGRYYDFAIVLIDQNYPKMITNGIEHIAYDKTIPIDCLIEIDGDFFHANPDKYDKKKLSKTQKRNINVDKLKNDWVALKGIPLLRFWENDIYKNKPKVINEMKTHIHIP